MLQDELVSLEYVQASIAVDTTGKRFASIMDRFGFYLATHEGKKGKLARNTAVSYYRNVKLWLFDLYPHLRVPTELQLLKQSKTLDKHCLKREKGGVVNKAPPCTKEDLRALTQYVYSNARVNADYQDAALACLMWHCFGRSSDLGYIKKQHVSVSADGVFYVRLLRVKTAEEQGLTLVPDKADFLTCPIHALAVALATQDAPCGSLLSQLPDLVPAEAAASCPGIPLAELLEADPISLSFASAAASSSGSARATGNTEGTAASSPQAASPSQPAPSHSAESARGEDGVQAYVNRLLKRVANPAGTSEALSSHSFRRGGAQHANADERLAPQWIFDRGAWDMSKVNKGFAYVFNTPQEDRKVARVLSGWSVDDVPNVVDVAALDHSTQEQLARLQDLLYSSCSGLNDSRFNVSHKVLAVLTAYLVKYFPQLKMLSPCAPIVVRVEECLDEAGISRADMIAWSSALNSAPSTSSEGSNKQHDEARECRGCHHSAVIEELIAMNRTLNARLAVIEAALLKGASTTVTQAADEQGEATSDPDPEPKPKRRKKQATHLSTSWYEWYTKVPPVWSSTDRQKKSESRHVVAFMKLFLVGGWALDVKAEDYKDQVLDAGRRAEKAVLAFLKSRGVNAKGSGSVLRALRPLHKAGVLDERVTAYKRLLAIGRIVDPAPLDTQDILTVVGHV
ncbi:Phosphatidylinositol 4-kinase PIK1 [Phytophthora cinnamomi]|uniref:Phosphatidylinositol 4-kinase PIK1 n=1 Tax=Phytophthora cinnamomi TaxID=4785 RepID=UPI00355A3032|nr:Phosphatidylinositol 4-kinase PIK1 [Phytophthora cinnamomi]